MNRILFCVKKVVIPLIIIAFSVTIIYFIGDSSSLLVNETVSNEVFVIKYKVYNVDDLEFVTFYIEDKNEQLIYSCSDNWRTFDFQGISFIDGSNDILVSSSDVGDTIYKFNDSKLTWIRQPQIVFNADGSTQFYDNETTREDKKSGDGSMIESEKP